LVRLGLVPPAGMDPGAAAAAAGAAAVTGGGGSGLPPVEFLALQRGGGLCVFDVRSPGEFEKGHVPGAVRTQEGGWSSPSKTCPTPSPAYTPCPAPAARRPARVPE